MTDPSLNADMALAQACAQGDAAAQGKLYAQYARKLMGVCMRYARCRADAEDIFQSAFVRAFERIGQYKGQGPLGAWLRRLFVTQSLRYLERQQRFTPEPIEEPDRLAVTDHEPDGLSSLQAEEIMQLVAALPEGARVVFTLFAIDGYTYTEIAAALHVSEQTSRSQLWRARQLLMQRLQTPKPILL